MLPSSICRGFPKTGQQSTELIAGVNLRWTSIPPRGGSRNTPSSSCYGNRDKLRPDGPLGSNRDVTFFIFVLLGCKRDIQERGKLQRVVCAVFPVHLRSVHLRRRSAGMQYGNKSAAM